MNQPDTGRRKINIDHSPLHKVKPASQDTGNPVSCGDESTKAYNAINVSEPVLGPVPAKSVPFDQSHQRVTTYLLKDVFTFISALRKQGKIKSVTDLYNQALYEYLHRYYGYEKNK